MTAFLFHAHGIGKFDFSRMAPSDVEPLDELARERDLELLPVIYLNRSSLDRLEALLSAHASWAAVAGADSRIAGFAFEGPLLGPHGGTPRSGIWRPTKSEWLRIAEMGSLGLRYIVMAPDLVPLEESVAPGLSFADLLLALYTNGVRVALGHFDRKHPDRSAGAVRQVLALLHSEYRSSRYLVLTDHLYNDMPRAFRHAWRNDAGEPGRDQELARILQPDWDTADLGDLLGPVPACLLSAARQDLLTPCLNFDGYHVDLEYCRRTVEFLGSDRLIAMTDHTERDLLAEENLRRDEGGVWLRSDGRVAAGSVGYEWHRNRMVKIDLTTEDIDRMFLSTPRAAAMFVPQQRQ